jgi:hypothetical protein
VLGGGREAVTRLIILAGAVGIGVGLLLTAVAGTNAATAWNNSHAWHWTGTQSVPAGPAATSSGAGIAPLWWHPGSDIFNGQTIDRFDVAATGASSPAPPGIAHDPGPGEYYASPALAALLRGTPAAELADRYPGHLAGTIGDAGLSSPNSLVIIIGHTPAQLARTPGSAQVTAIATKVPGNFDQLLNPNGVSYMPPDAGIQASGMDLILSVIALGMLTPVLIFIATATRLSAARREQRFAAMRLVGATRKQVSLLAAVESTVAAVVGVVAGFGIFFLLRNPVAGIPFFGQPFFPSQMSLSSVDILAVAIGVPVAAAVAARLALRRVHISPLGVARRTTPKPPRAWRTLPLLVGLAELGFFAIQGGQESLGEETVVLMSGFLLIIIGLVIAGPWLTMTAARFMARWTRRPGGLIAARRLADDPRAAFRAVSGLVLALFITTVAVVAITTQDAKDLTRWGSAAAAPIVTDQFAVSSGFANQVSVINNHTHKATVISQGQPVAGSRPAAPAAPLAARLRGIPGVTGVVVVRAYPRLNMPPGFDGMDAPPAGVISCAQLATVPALGRCPAGTTVAVFPEDGFNGPLFDMNTAGITWPALHIPAARLGALGVDAIDVATNGTVPAIEQVRTVLENASGYPVATAPSTLDDMVAQDHHADNAYRQLANTVILVSLPIAGCTLAAAIAAGLADRKRPFSLLRLTGARLAMLRRVVTLESAVPLLAVAAVAIGTGFGAAAEYASVAQHYRMVAPGAAYYLITAGGIVVALGIIAATFPLLKRITGPEVARNE